MDGNVIHGLTVTPQNTAIAYGSCSGCQTYAIALQVDLYDKSSNNVQPVNQAYAVNYQCNGCTTVARAVQYVVPTDDPDHLPPRVNGLFKRMQQQIDAIQRTPDITPDQAENQINSVIGQFQDLAPYLSDKRDVHKEPTTPGASAIPGDATPSNSATAAPSTSPAPSGSPSTSPAVSVAPPSPPSSSPQNSTPPNGSSSALPSASPASASASPSVTATP
ncbi:MAG: hypothetical protein JOZ39_10185 [Chloroflexi bacterium]|nr:hypothetical protein [Chloroflexota bacterium]